MKQFEVKLPNGDLIEGLSDQDVVDLVRGGRLTGDSLIRQQGEVGWRLVKSMPPVAAHFAASRAMAEPASRPKRAVKAVTVIACGSVAVLSVVVGVEAWYLFRPVTVPEWAELLEADPDPAVVMSSSLRSAIKATGYAWRVRDAATQIELVLIPPGSFEMGCSQSSEHGCHSDEIPVHAVKLTNAFYMGRYEVTQAQWTARMGSNPSYFQKASDELPASQVPNRPVERVTWQEVQKFLVATGTRLPTEAEWEYAYRAGTTTAFHSMPRYPNGTDDETLLRGIASCTESSNTDPRPVGQLAGNGYGLHDMSGNVDEWVSDWYSPTYYSSSPTVDPLGPSSGKERVRRGGRWDSGPHLCRSSSRRKCDPLKDHSYAGLRVARNP